MQTTKTLALAIATVLTIGGSAMAQSYHTRDGHWRGDQVRVGVSAGYVQAPGVYGDGYAYDDAYAYESRGSVGIYAQEPVAYAYESRGSVGIYAQEPVMGGYAQGYNDLRGRSDVSASQPSHNPSLDRAKGSF